MSIAQTFCSFSKLREPLADIQECSFFNGYYLHTFTFNGL
ncbi:hypothetical protein M079_3496 [Bacteroides fragilis str. 3996 N(B) 6]|uniref:Uncharacterized protein n=1 Tax=Bacteroides fragilis str. 3998T(B)3 TaxID=1339316 RepID=A0A015V2F8_BACFG|nr:hypothetical protein M079_3496 [Bacteroides fragilis str. 3996 N(B) 6]EXY89471.1 hypothetical protein M125_3864 [Bacteroides fragilis str. 3998T(B)3]EYE42798.1 hypothetical protein M138_3391 [Bacteroides fragilis str. S23L17]